MSVAARFDQFMRNIDLTRAQVDDVSTKRHNVGRTLHAGYYNSPYTGSTNFLGGSHGKQTANRPPSDIDLMFVVPYQTYGAFDQRTGNKQSQLLQHVRSVLQPSFPQTEIRADGQVVSVPFVSYRVEVVPCIELTSGAYWICDSNNGGHWKLTDPKAELAALNASDSVNNGNTRRLIRMAKVWRAACNVPIKPVLLELLAQDFLNGWAHRDKTSVYHDWMMRDFFAFLWSRKNTTRVVPGTIEYLALGNEWESRAFSAYQRAVKACEFEGANQEYSASEEWKKIFGEMFPNPPPVSASALLLGRGLLGR